MSVVVEVSARKFTIPYECVCCGATPQAELAASYTRTTGKRVIRQHTRSLTFPYCQRCYEHATRWSFANTLAGIVIGIGIIVAFVAGFASTSNVGWGIFAASCIIGVVVFVQQRAQASAQCAPGCASPRPAVDHLGWSGTVSSFGFQSRVYAVKFANGNMRNLINISMNLRKLLEQYAAMLQVDVQVHRVAPPVEVRSPSNAMPPTRPVPDDVVLGWISRIESYKGAEARRNALKRALEEVTEPGARRELMLAASRIEVAAVLDKVDSLTSLAAKKRHLQKAIADLQSDDIPDELQAAELRQLEDCLRELKSS